MLDDSALPHSDAADDPINSITHFTNELVAEVDCFPPPNEEEKRMTAVRRIWSVVKTAKRVATASGAGLSRELMLADEWITAGSDTGVGLLKLVAQLDAIDGGDTDPQKQGQTDPQPQRRFGSIEQERQSSNGEELDFGNLPILGEQQSIPSTEVKQPSKGKQKKKGKKAATRRNVQRATQIGKAVPMKRTKEITGRSTGGISTLIDFAKLAEIQDRNTTPQPMDLTSSDNPGGHHIRNEKEEQVNNIVYVMGHCLHIVVVRIMQQWRNTDAM